ncbi:MAG TPA: hypothetical protein VGW98_02170 [Solirubrobacteraceae bacterium]|nr:hypothetical protein [Solirubrobacteraceae bacterium]
MLIAIAACTTAAPAAAQTVAASIRASFLPNRLASDTAFTFEFELRSSEGEVPPPLSSMVVHLPAGLALDLRRAAQCPTSRLRSGGPAACPAGSLLGRGHTVLEVHAGSQTIPEEALLTALRTPNRGGHTSFALFGRGQTPLEQQSTSIAVVSRDGAPYGSKLTVSVPPIPSVRYEPDASIISSSMTLGVAHPGSRAHSFAAITVPRRCPAGGFPFAADFAFADGTSAHAAALIRCP